MNRFPQSDRVEFLFRFDPVCHTKLEAMQIVINHHTPEIGWNISIKAKYSDSFKVCNNCLENGTIPCYTGIRSSTKCRKCKGSGIL